MKFEIIISCSAASMTQQGSEFYGPWRVYKTHKLNNNTR